MSSRVSREHEGALLPRAPWDFKNWISCLLAGSILSFMLRIACLMLARWACSLGPDSPHCLTNFVSNSRTARYSSLSSLWKMMTVQGSLGAIILATN